MPDQRTAEQPKPLLVAVVDDDAGARKACARLLRAAGMRVETFASGAAFLVWITTSSPDCVVLDHHMPDLTGVEVQQRLVQIGANIPVVMITGQDEPEIRKRSTELGARAYLLKPFEDGALIGLLRSLDPKADVAD